MHMFQQLPKSYLSEIRGLSEIQGSPACQLCTVGLGSSASESYTNTSHVLQFEVETGNLKQVR